MGCYYHASTVIPVAPEAAPKVARIAGVYLNKRFGSDVLDGCTVSTDPPGGVLISLGGQMSYSTAGDIDEAIVAIHQKYGDRARGGVIEYECDGERGREFYGDSQAITLATEKAALLDEIRGLSDRVAEIDEILKETEEVQK